MRQFTRQPNIVQMNWCLGNIVKFLKILDPVFKFSSQTIELKFRLQKSQRMQKIIYLNQKNKIGQKI